MRKEDDRHTQTMEVLTKLGESMAGLASAQTALVNGQNEARMAELERRLQDSQLQNTMLAALLHKNNTNAN
jgi:predicted mannosyl-3-phosphoglycerate phosphatase (HAD superfamily)